MLLIHKDISHMPITELENDSESVWVKVFANKTSHFVASWYRPPGGDSEPEDQWSCKRSPDICILFQHYFSNLRPEASCL